MQTQKNLPISPLSKRNRLIFLHSPLPAARQDLGHGQKSRKRKYAFKPVKVELNLLPIKEPTQNETNFYIFIHSF